VRNFALRAGNLAHLRVVCVIVVDLPSAAPRLRMPNAIARVRRRQQTFVNLGDQPGLKFWQALP
jgi:hypothetical protein